MLSVKQRGIRYHFLSLWYDSTGDWTQISYAIGEHYQICTLVEVVAPKPVVGTQTEVKSKILYTHF